MFYDSNGESLCKPWEGVDGNCVVCFMQGWKSMCVTYFVLVPLLDGWLHRSLGWEVTLHGSKFCVVCRIQEDACHEILGFHPSKMKNI